MSHFHIINSQKLASNLFAATEAANAAWQTDRAAAVKIQSAVRAHQRRGAFLSIRACAIRIQRIYRGYCGRLSVLEHRIKAATHRQAQIFYCHARNIQRVFRGYLCRKYTNDFCAQKAYIACIQQTSESVRQAAIRARANQEAYLAKEQARELRADFESAIRDKHHLLSTAVSTGVLRSTLAPEGTATVFGTDIEDEIRSIPIERPKRAHFLKHVIPTGSSQQQAAHTSRTSAGAKVAAAASSSGASTTKSSQSSRMNFAIPKKLYDQELLSQEKFEDQDRVTERAVEQKYVSSLHGNGGGYFHVTKNAARSGQ